MRHPSGCRGSSATAAATGSGFTWACQDRSRRRRRGNRTRGGKAWSAGWPPVKRRASCPRGTRERRVRREIDGGRGREAFAGVLSRRRLGPYSPLPRLASAFTTRPAKALCSARNEHVVDAANLAEISRHLRYLGYLRYLRCRGYSRCGKCRRYRSGAY